MVRTWKRTNGRRRWTPAVLVPAAVLLVLSAAGYGYWGPAGGSPILSSRGSANPAYAPTYLPLCSPCFGPEPISVSTFQPAYISHVPCYSCFGNPYDPGLPVGGGSNSSTAGNVTVHNTVNVYQSVVMTPSGTLGDPWDACRCYGPAPYGDLGDLGISQTVDVDVDVNIGG